MMPKPRSGEYCCQKGVSKEVALPLVGTPEAPVRPGSRAADGRWVSTGVSCGNRVRYPQLLARHTVALLQGQGPQSALALFLLLHWAWLWSGLGSGGAAGGAVVLGGGPCPEPRPSGLVAPIFSCLEREGILEGGPSPGSCSRSPSQQLLWEQ